MGWLITPGILVLLAILPLGVHVRYDEDGARVMAVLGPVRILLYPRPKKLPKEAASQKQDKPKKEQKKAAPAKKSASKSQEKNKKGGSVTDFLPLVDVALGLVNDFRRKLRVNCLELKVIMAGGDPCDLAVNYGKAWAAMGNLLPRLEQVLVIQRRNIEIECDFTASSTLVTARVEITMTLGRLLALVFVNGIRGLIEFLKIMKKRKGGAVS